MNTQTYEGLIAWDPSVPSQGLGSGKEGIQEKPGWTEGRTQGLHVGRWKMVLGGRPQIREAGQARSSSCAFPTVGSLSTWQCQ